MDRPKLDPLDTPAGARPPARPTDRDRRLDGLFRVVRGVLEQMRDEELGVVSPERRWVRVRLSGRVGERIHELLADNFLRALQAARRLFYARTGLQELPLRRQGEAPPTPADPFMQLVVVLLEPGEGLRDQVTDVTLAEIERTRDATTPHFLALRVLDEYDGAPCPEGDTGIGEATSFAVRMTEQGILDLGEVNAPAFAELLARVHAAWDRQSAAQPLRPAATKAGRFLEWLDQVEYQ